MLALSLATWLASGLAAGVVLFTQHRESGGEAFAYIVNGAVFGLVAGAAFLALYTLLGARVRASLFGSALTGLGASGVFVLFTAARSSIEHTSSPPFDPSLDAVLLVGGFCIGALIWGVRRLGATRAAGRV